MSDKKNIDRLFQEKLKDFEVAPNNSVWENISKELFARKKQRKIIPLWWKITGIAASLLLFLSLGNLFFKNDTTIPKQKIVNTDFENPFEKTPTQKPTIEIDSIHSKKSASENSVKDSKSKINNVLKSKIDNSKKSIIALTDELSEKVNGNTLELNTKISSVAVLEKSKNSIKKEDLNISLNTDVVITNTRKEITTPDSLNVKASRNQSNLSIEDVLASINDTEESIKDDKEVKEKWSISPRIAPIYSNSLGIGSSIDERFQDNSKSGDLDMSYGISASYAINKKIKVRTGINKVNVGYYTNDVIAYKNPILPTSVGLVENINFIKNTNTEVITFFPPSKTNLAQAPSIISSTTTNTTLAQKLEFIEIPIELEYNISHNKLGFSIIGGFSALFLSDNGIYSINKGQGTLMGKATNINSTSYSANLGLGLDYNISKKINFNLEPIFKYQLNTFNNTSGNFKPYFIGVYTGFSFKF